MIRRRAFSLIELLVVIAGDEQDIIGPQIAVHEPEAFKALVDQVRAH